MTQQTHKFYVKGMHCKACTFLIQDIVSGLEGVDDVKVSLKNQTLEIRSNDLTSDHLSDMINPLIIPQGYSIHIQPQTKTINWWEYILALIISAVLIYGFIELQKLWLLQMFNIENRTYGTSFIIWLIASVSSCLAVVWWVVLALWAVYSKNSSFVPHSLFHIGRLVGFFILGGVLWIIGATFQLSQNVSIILNMIIAAVLLILWLNLLWVIRWWMAFWWNIFKHFSIRDNSFLWPLLIGVGTFFLPCGFTQSMQVYTLSTHSFLSWWLTMLSFALGTLPMLLLLSITWKTIQQSESSGLLFKVVGIILIILWVYNFASSLVSLGIINPFFSL